LGSDLSRAMITAPGVKNLQPSRTFKLNEEIPVKKGKDGCDYTKTK
jgi:hypothetical protein